MHKGAYLYTGLWTTPISLGTLDCSIRLVEERSYFGHIFKAMTRWRRIFVRRHSHFEFDTAAVTAVFSAHFSHLTGR
jgi:hypothetical protein